MPFYEYECDNCKFYTELLQKITDPPLKKCPSCGKSRMRKLVSAPVFRLKGGGWYETDFKSDKEGQRNLAVEKEPESVSDAKPAAKVEAADTKASATQSQGAESKASEPKGESARSRGRARPAAAAKSKAAAKSRAKPARKPPKRRKKSR
jgi:putative FmdB family regulatory protein